MLHSSNMLDISQTTQNYNPEVNIPHGNLKFNERPCLGEVLRYPWSLPDLAAAEQDWAEWNLQSRQRYELQQYDTLL
jgi:hypothetical protein